MLSSSSSPSHSRSVSLNPPKSGSPRNYVSRAQSTNALPTMAAAESIPEHPNAPESLFHTVTDPRSNSNPDLSSKDATSSHHPGLNTEVATLSDKLINAINHSTSLDDTLAQTRHELEASRARIAQLEAETKAHEERLARGELVTRDILNQQNTKLSAELEDERRQKAMVQQEKRGIENELETLTAQLFDEANKMVASANMQRDAVERKNQQLRDQIKDGEAVITSQSEQLTELKTIMQQIGTDARRDLDSPQNSLAPASPALSKDETTLARLLEAMNMSPITPEHGEIVPGPSTTFTHLLKPQCRSDVPAYDDFRSLIQNSNFRSHNPSHAASRAGSGSYGGLNVMGLGSLNNSSSPNLSSTSQPATSKLANSPALPGSFSPTPDTRGPIPLKETKFFKRIMFEDVEPTLRLDLSPTISWLTRRSILSALADSTLIVEPNPESSMRMYGRYTPCSLCGESRKEDQNPRTHAMRVREGEGATKWPICTLCLEKVRAVGDLVAYVRMIREGVVKVGDKHEEEEAWEELIRLRERLFWARLAGGVVPAFLPNVKNMPVVVDEMPGTASTEDDKENKTPNFTTPSQSRRGSEEGEPGEASKDEMDADLQLPQGLNEGLTTFDNAKEKMAQNGTASPQTDTAPKKRESGGFPRLSIPKLSQNFWESQVNTLR